MSPINSQQRTFRFTEQFTVLWLLFVVIVAGNTAVLAGLLLGKRRKSRMDFFIKQLAFAGYLNRLQSSFHFIADLFPIKFQIGASPHVDFSMVTKSFRMYRNTSMTKKCREDPFVSAIYKNNRELRCRPLYTEKENDKAREEKSNSPLAELIRMIPIVTKLTSMRFPTNGIVFELRQS
ncbi:cardioacceleratory peptide receptor-like isoform X1 [Vespula maculifrons]|uniref:Cardioacceleratory peptide receptor-like isoform X1 n=1 Tax=Vespula maculifrons TaxID=7453 RepID=A0ABD2CX17_VESMC